MKSNYSLGLVGHPVSKSLSPPMHQAALAHCGLTGDYKLFDILPSDLLTGVKKLRQQGLDGFNVTIPHKTAVLHNCERSSAVERVGAANTIKFLDDGTTIAYNTDITGFSNALKQVYDFEARTSKHKIACLLGAGGAAKAALDVLMELGFERIFICSRDATKAQHMANNWKNNFHCKAQLTPVDFTNAATISGADLFVNTIPFGQTVSIEKQFLGGLFSGGGVDSPFVYDMVYSREGLKTALVELCSELEISACDGTGMLVHQALAAFEIWTEQTVPFEVMHEALVQARTLNASAHNSESK